MAVEEYKPGDCVIFRVEKRSSQPSRRGVDVEPEPLGDKYHFHVDKFWRVEEVKEDGELLVRTRRGKLHSVRQTNGSLRHPRWWEMLLYRGRFPDPSVPLQPPVRPIRHY